MTAAGRKAYILSYQRGCKTQNERYAIVEVEGVSSRSEACALIGRKVVWKNPISGELFTGRIVDVHGCSGRLRARFAKPLPGQAIGSEAKVF
ncbi:MAG: 50S ribosomal protein L35ae [Thermofilum sp.]